MFKLLALNETTENASSLDKPSKDTKEAQEAQAFKLYNEALRLQQIDCRDEAVQVYEQLLKTPLIVESATTLVNEHNEAIEHPLKDPGLILKYSAHKNVASICASKGDKNKAMENYLQAVMLDTSDVALWYKIGILAAKLSNLHLSRRALTQGLECNPNHWPCLDSLISVCYALLDYENCLRWISKALSKDSYYKKGIFLRRKMIKECPHLERDFDHIFRNCGSQVFEMEIVQEDADEFLHEAFTLRENYRKLCIPPEIPIVPLTVPLKSLTWLNLGESLLATYEFIETQDEPISITSPIDMKVFHGDIELKFNDRPMTSSTHANLEVSKYSVTQEKKEPTETESKSNSASYESTSTGNLTGANNDSKISVALTPGLPNSNKPKKPLKRKKPPEKISELGRRSERRSSRMKPRHQSKSVEEPPPTPELDFRQNLLKLLPKTLQIQSKPLPVDMDSDTNSQDSSIVCPDQENNYSSPSVISTDVQSSKIARLDFDDSMLKQDVHGKPELSIDAPATTTGGVLMIDSSPHEKTSTSKSVDDNFQEQSCSELLTSKNQKTEFDLPSSMKDSVEVAMDTDTSAKATVEISCSPSVSALNAQNSSMQALVTESIKPTLPRKASKEELEEEDEVRKFINDFNDTNNGILNVLLMFCKTVGRRSHDVVWETGFKQVFLRCYYIMQSSLRLEPFVDDNLDTENKITFAYYILTHLECSLDVKYKKHSSDFKYFPSTLEYRDMGYIIDASYHPEILEQGIMPQYRFKNFVLRYHWVRATCFYLSGDKRSVLGELTMCSKFCFEDMEIKLHHLENHNVINPSSIAQRINSLKRFQLLEDIEELLQREEFSEALKVLNSYMKPTELYSQEGHKSPHHGTPIDFERPKLLTYVIRAAVGLNDTRLLLENLLNCFHEIVFHIPYLFAKKSSKEPKFNRLYDSWRSVCNLCFSNLAGIINKNLDSLLLVEKEELSKFTNNLVSLNHHNLVNLPTKSQLLLKGTSVKHIFTPWILLHQTTMFAETHSDDKTTDNLPSSALILAAAHDWFGEKGCCCVDHGVMVRLLLKQLLGHMNKLHETSLTSQDRFNVSHTDSEKSMSTSQKSINMQTCIEQCFFCLYGYPNKLGKSSRLTDHGSHPLPLKWQDSTSLYNYFKPLSLPAFDSYKVNTILSDMAGLLLKILKMIPECIQTKLLSSLKVLDEYMKMDDVTSDLEIEPVCDEGDLLILGDIYYLLADYYFKNKDMPQAGKYYMYDLCINPQRFDSWAALALVKSSILDQRIRLCSSKLHNQVTSKEESIVLYSKATLFCFKKAMTIEDYSTTLWIEYGTFAYWMHSYFSRQIKFKKHTTKEAVTLCKKKKMAMLDQAKVCFEAALGCDSEDVCSEEWLILYMLGKVQEKKFEAPQKFLPNYSRAASLLHRRHAKYPKKIQFKSYQTDYAIESLEMYFRIHCSALRLVQHELNVLNGFDDGEERCPLTKRDFDLMIDIIEEAETSNFVRRESLPSHQLYDKLVDSGVKKPLAKLTNTVTENQAKLSMGSLLPDAVVSALSSQLAGDSTADDMETDETVAVNESLESAPLSEKSSSALSEGALGINSEQHAVTENMTKSLPLTKEKRIDLCSKVLKSCVSALHLCLGRLPQHYKAIYRLADLYWRCLPESQHISWACDLLLGSSLPWQNTAHMPCQGLLSEKNKTNLFNGVWKIPVDEIDRPGSFGYHLYRCIILLLDVLHALTDHRKLFYLHNMLNRTPDQGRKYLKDTDRVLVCKKALSYCIKSLHKKVSSVSTADATNASERLQHLMDAAKICQQKQRMSDPVEDILPKKHTERHKELLILAYERYIIALPPITTPLPNLDFVPAVVKVERILKFCQQHTSSFPSTPKTHLCSFSQQFDFTMSDLSTKKNTEVAIEKSAKKDAQPCDAIVTKESDCASSVKKAVTEVLAPGISVTKKQNYDSEIISVRLAEECVRSPIDKIIEDRLATDLPPENSEVSLIYNMDSDKESDVKKQVEDFQMILSSTNSPTSNGETEVSLGTVTHTLDSGFGMQNIEAPQKDSANNNCPIIGTTQLSSVENKHHRILVHPEGASSPLAFRKTVSEDFLVSPNTMVNSKSVVPSFDSGSAFCSPKAEVTTVIQGGSTYTKIVPCRKTASLSPSLHSAFTPRKKSEVNLQIQKLKDENRAPLARSSSLPETPSTPSHKNLRRTGSISDYTKQKLKSSILLKTSASLVKKPSITTTEMEQILCDIESSQSEEDEDSETTFKPVVAAPMEPSNSQCKPIDVPVEIMPVAMSITSDNDSDFRLF